ELNTQGGPGEIQTEAQWSDFVLQLDVRTNSKHSDGGISFRSIPGERERGYLVKIRNQWLGEDRGKAVEYGTGGLLKLQAARKVIPNDTEWFTQSIVAHGNHVSVWVNGVQVTEFTDTRPVGEDARKACRLDKGAIGLQGTAATTDISFRGLR